MEPSGISIPATFTCLRTSGAIFMTAWIMHVCLWDFLTTKEKTTDVNASKSPQELKWRQCVFFSSAAAGAPYSTGLILKTGEGWNKKLRAEASSCVHHHPLAICRFLQAALTGQNDRLLKLPGLRFTGAGLQWDRECWIIPLTLPRRTQLVRYAESISNIDLVKCRFLVTRNNEILFEQQTSSMSSQDGGPSWNIDNARRRGENTPTPHGAAVWGFKPAAFLPLGTTVPAQEKQSL